MLPYCQETTIPYLPLIPEVDLTQYTGNNAPFHITVVKKEHVNPEMYKLVDDIGLMILRTTVFYKSPGFVEHKPHIDLMIPDFARLNWVYHGEGSKMRWYKVKDPNKVSPLMSSKIGAPYYEFERDNIELAFEKELTKPTLIQACIPHDIVQGDSPRFAVSMLLKKKGDINGPLITMKEGLEYFSRYI